MQYQMFVCNLGGCTITSKTKINVFWNFFFTPLAPSGPLHLKKFQKTLILAFEANSALSHESETKFVKITHIVKKQLVFRTNCSYIFKARFLPIIVFVSISKGAKSDVMRGKTIMRNFQLDWRDDPDASPMCQAKMNIRITDGIDDRPNDNFSLLFASDELKRITSFKIIQCNSTCTQWARKLKKKSRPKKLMKSNKSISRNFILTKFHFLQFQKWPKINFWTGEKLKTAKNAISRKKMWFIWFHEFFCLDFFKFSGPRCVLFPEKWLQFFYPIRLF